jgi:hypothetical protein
LYSVVIIRIIIKKYYYRLHWVIPHRVDLMVQLVDLDRVDLHQVRQGLAQVGLREAHLGVQEQEVLVQAVLPRVVVLRGASSGAGGSSGGSSGGAAAPAGSAAPGLISKPLAGLIPKPKGGKPDKPDKPNKPRKPDEPTFAKSTERSTKSSATTSKQTSSAFDDLCNINFEVGVGVEHQQGHHCTSTKSESTTKSTSDKDSSTKSTSSKSTTDTTKDKDKATDAPTPVKPTSKTTDKDSNSKSHISKPTNLLSKPHPGNGHPGNGNPTALPKPGNNDGKPNGHGLLPGAQLQESSSGFSCFLCF